MSNDQIRRANRVVFPVIIVIMLYVLFTLVAFVAVGGAAAMSGKVLLQLVVTVIATIVTIVLFVAKKDTSLCANGMLNISGQTNLLAHNASIEAARAGGSGSS